jgi:hypothetical protein
MAAYAGAQAITNFVKWAYRTGEEWNRKGREPVKRLSPTQWKHIKERHFPDYPSDKPKGNLFPVKAWGSVFIYSIILAIANNRALPEFQDLTYKSRAYRFLPVYYKGYACVIKVVYAKKSGEIITAYPWGYLGNRGVIKIK